MSYKYQWLANGAAISGATSSTFTPSAGLAGKRISVKITASATGYTSVSVSSGQTAAVAKGTIENTSAPVVSGAPKVGVPVGVTNGSWSPKPTSYAYQWFANGVAIAGATGSTYTPDPAAAGNTLSAQVTAQLLRYDASKTSAPTAAVASGDLTNTAIPTISGDPAVGNTLTVGTGSMQLRAGQHHIPVVHRRQPDPRRHRRDVRAGRRSG